MPAEPFAAPPTPPARRSRRGRWLLVGAVAWAVVLAVAAAISFHRDEPTVREQRDVAQAAPVVDAAAGELVAAAAGMGVTMEVSSRRLTEGCRITSARDGAALERTVTARAPGPDTSLVLERVRERLPTSYRAGLRRGEAGEATGLRADAGEFVAITGAKAATGVVEFVVKTGCRPAAPGYDPGGTEADRKRTGTAKVTLMALVPRPGTAEVELLESTTVPCPGGKGTYESQVAEGPGVLDPAKRERLRDLPYRAVVDTPTRLAFVTETGVFDVRAEDGRLVAASTEGRGNCPHTGGLPGR